MSDAKNRKVPSIVAKDRVVEWTDDPGPAVAYIRTDLPKPDLCTADPVLERSAEERLKEEKKSSRQVPRE